ncbi:hypothetical protein GDI1546 [Gluconacetobacter diazotrophicus PA1 5]|uniref:Uncharacterized protein n=1 Tax=Gluconacetobacter diazotrophicus (strain ATCC 49037 / DSM 5601 / CCUG 37298 / CIP 103539 / LMG 7603 / PAl5) TaxID=272568 RepID=A9HGE7_GLUDA|nr:hypothetical protein GDI1546 [Gluconacetobacter diazotrophicus PA1 5]
MQSRTTGSTISCLEHAQVNASWDSARVPVMLPRESDGKMRHDERPAAHPRMGRHISRR